jgi:hypothetical protein
MISVRDTVIQDMPATKAAELTMAKIPVKLKFRSQHCSIGACEKGRMMPYVTYV